MEERYPIASDSTYRKPMLGKMAAMPISREQKLETRASRAFSGDEPDRSTYKQLRAIILT
ncbi:MAG TPA: hypothetical protein VIH42_04835 [Thermoguttaceae bacterium]